VADGRQVMRALRYAANAAQHSSIDEPTNCSTSVPSDVPTNTRTRGGSRSLQTRIVATHVEASPTVRNIAPRRSPKRHRSVVIRVHRGGVPAAEAGPTIRLLNGFDVTLGGRPLRLSANVQRLLALLALRERPQPRSIVAATLWIDRPGERAAANLRTALWKLGADGHHLIVANDGTLAIADEVAVDFRIVARAARELVQENRPPRGETQPDEHLAVDMFAGDLLPDWDEDWIQFERERLRQLRIHAIEALSRQYTSAGRFAEAVDAGLTAVAADTLRESAHRVLIEAYLGEGNVVEARRQFDQFRAVLWHSLRLEPSNALSVLVGTP
jgi:DNA-binding SARP family transcriptional activator